MPQLVTDGDRRLVELGQFRVIFLWNGDRWVHSLEAPFEGESSHRVLAGSLESDPARDDPRRVVSPAYQDLHFQENGANLQALLVGQSGPHHFSAVFTFVNEIFGDVSILVDVADRCRTPVEALASTYRVRARSNELADANSTEVSWNFGAGLLSFVATPPAQVALAEAGRLATSIQALASLDHEPGSATHRLAYHWHWC